MRKLFTIVILLCSVVLPTTGFAEENTTEYIIHAEDKKMLQRIVDVLPETTETFDLLPMIEVSLTDSEKRMIRELFPQIDIYPVRTYETSQTIAIPTQSTLKNVSSNKTSPYTGKGVKVGVIDTGIDVDHTNLTVSGGICTLQICPSPVAYDDDHGHGSHVAGIIAAKDNNSGTVGVAPNVDLYAIKAISKRNEGTTTNIAKGIEWAIQHDMDIVNMSISTPYDDYALQLVIEKAYNAGVMIVAAAGNEEDGSGKDSVQYPAKYPTVIAVSAIMSDKKRLYESSMGPEVELAAPGHAIMSTIPKELDMRDGTNDGYTKMSGTSMAAPYVTGLVALYKEQFPTYSNQKIREILAITAEDIGAPGRDREFGYGIAKYSSDINEVPVITYDEAKGHIKVSLQNADGTTNRKLTVNGEEVSEISLGQWEMYRMAGMYDLNVMYTNQVNQVENYRFTINVSSPFFKDFNSTKWYSSHIAYLTNREVITGFTDGTFKPDRSITRAQAVTMLGRAFDLNGEQRNTRFKDVRSGNNASGYIQAALEAEFISGFPDGTFRPDQAVTRAEMAIMVQQAFKFQYNASSPLTFKDMAKDAKSYGAVQALLQKGVTEGFPDGTFKPDQHMNRATFSVFLARAERPDLYGK